MYFSSPVQLAEKLLPPSFSVVFDKKQSRDWKGAMPTGYRCPTFAVQILTPVWKRDLTSAS